MGILFIVMTTLFECIIESSGITASVGKIYTNIKVLRDRRIYWAAADSPLLWPFVRYDSLRILNAIRKQMIHLCEQKIIILYIFEERVYLDKKSETSGTHNKIEI